MENQEVKHIVKVQYYSDDGRLSDRAYTYYSETALAVGDIITVPVRDTTSKAKVSVVDVPEAEIEAFKAKVKTIPTPTLKTAKEIVEKMPVIDDAIITEALRDIEPEITEPLEVRLEIAGDAYMMVGKAIIKVNPESDPAILLMVCEGNKLRDYAEKRIIATDADMKGAVDDLSLIAKVKKALIAKKDEYVKPIKAYEDAVKNVFAIILTPLEDADRINRQKWTAYRNEQTRRQTEAEAINREKLELAKRENALNGEHTVDLTPVVAPAPVARVQTDMGTVGVMHVRKYRVVNFAELSDQYKIENSVLLNKVVKAGIPSIPGVEIYFDESLRVNTK